MNKSKFTVVIPAHNEEKYIGKCLKSVISASKYVAPDCVEIIVVANRCSDKTCEIAKHYGARVLINDNKCIAAIRNTGVKAAKGEIVITIDADSMMTKYSLIEIKEKISKKKIKKVLKIGGYRCQEKVNLLMANDLIIFYKFIMYSKNRCYYR